MDFGRKVSLKIVFFFLWIFRWIFSCLFSQGKWPEKIDKKIHQKFHRGNQTPKSTKTFREGVSLTNGSVYRKTLSIVAKCCLTCKTEAATPLLRDNLQRSSLSWHLSSPNRAMQVCDAMYFSNPPCESRDLRALDWTKTSDLCSAICVAANHLCDAMHLPAICALTAEIHCDVDHDASITAIAMPRCGELRLASLPACDPFLASSLLCKIGSIKRLDPDGPNPEGPERHLNAAGQKFRIEKRTPKPKNRTNSAKECSEQFEGVTGHSHENKGFEANRTRKFTRKFGEPLCRKSSLGYRLCP